MITAQYPLEWSARLVVGSVRTLTRRRIAVSCIGLVLTMLAAGGYIALGALRVNPTRSTILVRVLLPQSGGLLPDQDVTLRGTPIGRVQSVNFTDTGVVAVAALDAGVSVPDNSMVRVSPLSPAGEQYLDFRPLDNHGPPLTDGSVIGEDLTTVPVPLAQLLSDTDGALAQLDPHKLAAITGELQVSRQGPRKLAALLDGGTFLISTLDSVLPQTVSVLRNSPVLLTTLADTNPGLQHTAENLHELLDGINAMDGGFRLLVDRGSAPFSALDTIIADNSDTMVQLLGNLTTIAQLSYVRVPALKALFPTTRGSVLDAVDSIVHDGGIWGIGDIYPRYSCDYNLPRRPPSQADFVEPYRYTYCANADPSVLVRGARNAPRPPGDDTAGPPPGYDPHAQTDPTPLGPNSIPTPYGGPQLPTNPPELGQANMRTNGFKRPNANDVFSRLDELEDDPPETEITTNTPEVDPTAEADEAAAHGPGETAANAAPISRRRRLLHRVAAAATALVFVAALAATAYLGWQLKQRNDTAAAGRAALAVAQSYAVTLTSVDTNTIDQNFNQVLNGATGEFKDMYSQSAAQLRQVLIDNKAMSKGTVVDAAIKSATKTKVEVLLFIDQSISNVVNPQPRIDRSRVAMTMELIDNHWLASKVDIK